MLFLSKRQKQRELLQKMRHPVEVVCFDTLSANYGDADEQTAKDINRVLTNARTACNDRACIFIHHVGHSAKDRERGSYALTAEAEMQCR